MSSVAEEIFLAAHKRGRTPDPAWLVSDWSDKYRMLSQKGSAEPGPWKTKRTPYLKEVMDSLSPSCPVQQVVFMKGAQIGATEAGTCWVGYCAATSPGPMMCVQPTVDLVKRFSKQKIDPLFEESPVLKALLADPRSRDSGNTCLTKEFQGGLLILTGANSAVGLRSTAVRYLMLDELDAFPQDVDNEGSPVALAEARTRTFARRKIFKVSTPTIEGRSQIAQAYEDSDQRRFFVPCPHCGFPQILQWPRVKWPKGEPDKAYYQCENCPEPIYNHHKTRMLEAGEWIAQRPELSGKIAGFHLSSLYSPVGWFSWMDAATMWEKAIREKNEKALKTFINTFLGETWKEKGEAPEWKRLYDRREDYELQTVPQGGLFLTAGIDVQTDRIEIQVVAWGVGKESWLVDYCVLEGRPSETRVWEELTTFLGRTYPHASGAQLSILKAAIDTGHATNDVYSWARRQAPKLVMPVKGYDHGPIINQGTPQEVTERGRRIASGIKLWSVNVSELKSELYGRLKLESPIIESGEPFPPGYCHFPQVDEEFFKQLTAEQLITRKGKDGYEYSEWSKMRDRNEVLDTRVYARAAATLLGMDRYRDIDWQALQRFLQPPPEVEETPLPASLAMPPAPPASPTAPAYVFHQPSPPRPAPPANTQQPPNQRFQPVRSGWMNRK
jgi:phage terminase large subunit GpA-like protein